MKLRSRFNFWVAALIIIATIMIVVPAASKTSIVEIIDRWVDDYSEAVEDAQADDDDDEDHDDDLEIGKLMVRVNDDIGDYAGVETLRLVETDFSPEAKALVKVVDVRPMLVLRARHKHALAALNIAKVSEQANAKELTRLKSLSRGAGSVATKNVNYAEAAWRESKAELQGLNVDLQAVGDETLQTWGKEIASWILSNDSKQWEKLLIHEEFLLLVTLPVGLSLDSDVSFIRISRNGLREEARKAYFVAPALVTEQGVQGETYFFKTASGKLRTGMQIAAWVPKGNEVLKGIFIPDEAIVWSVGQPWVYVQVEEDLYQRRSVQVGLPIAGGLLIEQELKVGEILVITGAQMLLSEEFRWQILDEDDD
ncbi:MAG: hypothetical protein ACKE9I_09680 [Methylophagaceae bacterium]